MNIVKEVIEKGLKQIPSLNLLVIKKMQQKYDCFENNLTESNKS
jgi:hypothetical protein